MINDSCHVPLALSPGTCISLLKTDGVVDLVDACRVNGVVHTCPDDLASPIAVILQPGTWPPSNQQTVMKPDRRTPTFAGKHSLVGERQTQPQPCRQTQLGWGRLVQCDGTMVVVVVDEARQ